MVLRFLGILSLLATVVPAQNKLEVYPGDGGAGTRFVRRGTFGALQGSIFQSYPPSHFRGIGDDGSACSLRGVQFLIQDQDRRTQEAWTVAVRRGDANGPWAGSAGLIAGLPAATPPDTGSGTQVWEITLDATTPIAIPCAGEFFVGHQLPAAVGWPVVDGLAPWVYLYREDPNLFGLPHHAWQIIGSVDTGVPSQPDRQVINIALRTTSATLTIGTVSDPITHPGQRSPDFGPTGMYPDVDSGPGSAAHGLLFRVRDRANAGGFAILLLGSTFDPPLSLGNFGINGSLWMTTHLDGQMTFGDALDSTGEVWIARDWYGPAQLHRLAGAGPAVLQAVTFSLSGGQPVNVRVSNAASVLL